MPITLKDLMEAANAAVPRLPADEVAACCARGAVLLDVRDPHEIAASGKIAGAIAVSRGMLEFRACSSSPARHPELRPEVMVVVYCASGGRAALAARTLQELGYTQVVNAGGFKDLAGSGLPVEPG